MLTIRELKEMVLEIEEKYLDREVEIRIAKLSEECFTATSACVEPSTKKILIDHDSDSA